MNAGIPIIVVIEDSDEDFHLVEMAVEEFPREIKLKRYCNGELAVQAIDDATLPIPSLFILDLRMPGISGIEVLRRLKGNERYSTVPVNVISTSSNPVEIREVYLLNANAFHVKDVETPKMFKLITDMLNFWINLVRLPPPTRDAANAS